MKIGENYEIHTSINVIHPLLPIELHTSATDRRHSLGH
jgi:hypothetical protein